MEGSKEVHLHILLHFFFLFVLPISPFTEDWACYYTYVKDPKQFKPIQQITFAFAIHFVGFYLSKLVNQAYNVEHFYVFL